MQGCDNAPHHQNTEGNLQQARYTCSLRKLAFEFSFEDAELPVLFITADVDSAPALPWAACGVSVAEN